MRFSVFQVSRKGGREKNEDRMGYCYTNGASIFLVADGMGGHPQGEVAAQMALQVIAGLFQREAMPELPDVRIFLHDAVMAAHRRILAYAAEKKRSDTPRTTLVAAVLQGGMAYWVHCGDSRLYFVRDGELLARTRDHSHLERRQVADPAGQAGPMMHRNVLYTCLGSPRKPVIDVVGPVKLQQGDKFLLCSDGLWAKVPDEEIVVHMGQHSVSSAAIELVERALHLGGAHGDNVTAVAMEWEAPDASDPERGDVLTEMLQSGGFASTVQADWIEDDQYDLDEAAIERSIAEINEAIRRTATRKN